MIIYQCDMCKTDFKHKSALAPITLKRPSDSLTRDWATEVKELCTDCHQKIRRMVNEYKKGDSGG